MSHDRLTRKDMKRDEIAEAVGSSMDYVRSHTRPILLGVVAVVAAALAVAATLAWLSHRKSEAGEALARAMTVYQGRIDSAAPKPDDPRDPSFASEEARSARARELFGELAESYGGTDAGQVAWLYLGRLAFDAGDREAARGHWRRFADERGGDALAVEARLNLIRLDREDGRGEEVIAELEPMLDEPEPPLPADVVLFELAVTYEQVGRGEDARSTFQRLAEEYPNSGYAAEARQRGGAAAGPGLGLPPIDFGG